MSNQQTIAVIDYGMGNLRSVSKALNHVAKDSQILITNDKQQIEQAEKIVFPGVGAVSHCMEELIKYDLIEPIKKAALEKPFLGICLGMQLLFDHSEENQGTKALGVFDGVVSLFNHANLKIPHMGWNNVRQTIDHPLWHKINNDSQFYFVHSYFVQPKNNINSGICNYGHEFTASIASDNIFATQFHPEKSQSDGLQLLKNFSTWKGIC